MMRWACTLLNMLLMMVLISTTATNSTDNSKSFCYDACSGHGRCVANVCKCDPGWFGENCKTSFGENTPLTVGGPVMTSHVELTQFLHARQDKRPVLVGISDTTCAKCGAFETQYKLLVDAKPELVLIRVNLATSPDLVKWLSYGSTTGTEHALAPPDIPYIMMIWDTNWKRKAAYRGVQEFAQLVEFVNNKVLSHKPYMEGYPGPMSSTTTYVWVMGYFSTTPKRFDSDEFADFVLAAEELRFRHDILFAVAMNECPMEFLQGGDKSFLSIFARDGSLMITIPLDEEPPSISNRVVPSLSQFISFHATAATTTTTTSTPQLVKLTAESYMSAEAVGLPMFLFFSSTSTLDPILHHALLKTSREFKGKFTFLWGWAPDFKVQMRTLGLYDVTITSMAINGKTRETTSVFASSSKNPITPTAIHRFCMEHLQGRAPRMGSGSTSKPTCHRYDDDCERENADVVGVKEMFRVGRDGKVLTFINNKADWLRVVMNDTQDVLVFVDDAQCEPCRAVTPIFRRVALRLNILQEAERVTCAVLFRDEYVPDVLLHIKAPAMVLFPAFRKHPLYFSEVAKVFPIMEWVRVNAGVKFEWKEELPQFDESQKQMFREQIRDRELGKKNKDEL